MSQEINAKTKLLGVVGWPVEHSLSPAMHNAALAALGLNMVYVALPVAPEQFEQAVRGAQAMGWVGLNVTIPHKLAALAIADQPDPLAQAIGAANTLHFEGGVIRAYNTDPVGYVRTVQEEGGFDFTGQSVLQIGAGGVGRAMATGAAQAGAARVVIHARNLDKALALAEQLGPHFPGTQFSGITGRAPLEKAAAECALIANATPLGMKAGDPLPLPAELIQPSHVVFDTVYVPALTPLLAEAASRGARTVGGLGMLARQGARSLEIWTGRQPDQTLMQRTIGQKIY